MSFILDALKKSESERQKQAGPALLEMRIVRPAHQLPIWAVVVGVLLIVSVAALAWLVLRTTPAPAGAAVPAPAPVSAAMTAGAPTNAAPASAAVQAPAAQSAAVPGPAAIGPQAPGTAPAAAIGSPQQQSSGAGADSNPADTEPAVTAPAAAREGRAAENLRSYAELGGSLPELRLDLHVYSTNPAERYAFINMHKVREGDVTAEGVQVKEITREGVVLDYRGTEFLLGHQ